MKPTLLVVADLGNFKAYRWDGDELHSTPRLELVDAFEAVDARYKRVRNTLTVLEGRSAKGGSNPKLAGAGSDGEQHNMHLEKRRRLVRQMVDGLTALLKPKEIERCFFAAPQEINEQIVNHIPPAVRQKIEKNLVLDLTKLDKPALIDHFFKRAEAER